MKKFIIILLALFMLGGLCVTGGLEQSVHAEYEELTPDDGIVPSP